MSGKVLPPCQYGDQCRRKNPQHFKDESHPCKYGNDCIRKNPQHFIEETHPPELMAKRQKEEEEAKKAKAAARTGASSAVATSKSSSSSSSSAGAGRIGDKRKTAVDGDDDDDAEEKYLRHDDDRGGVLRDTPSMDAPPAAKKSKTQHAPAPLAPAPLAPAPHRSPPANAPRVSLADLVASMDAAPAPAPAPPAPAPVPVRVAPVSAPAPAPRVPLSAPDTDTNESNPFTDMRFAITGTLSMVRKDIIGMIEQYGGRYIDAINGSVTHLICADPSETTSKLQKARAMGIEVVSEDWLLEKKQKADQHRARSGAEEKKGDDGEEEMDDAEEGGGDEDGDGPKPLHVMKDGEAVTIMGNSGRSYEIRYRGGVHYCTCTAWRFQNTAIDQRTCKHLRIYLGEEFDQWRTGRTNTAPIKVDKTDAPPLLLAQKWDGSQDITGWWVSEKLDGVRAYWNGKKLISRLGNAFFAPDWFLAGFPKDVKLDGELYLGRKKFQAAISIVKSQDRGEAWRQLTYQLFDAPSLNQPFEQRMQYLQTLIGINPYVRIVRQTKCNGPDELKEQMEQVQKVGGEGLMLRQPGSMYVGTRSSTLLKVKEFHDDEAKIIGYVSGKGKYVGAVGALQVQLANGLTFSVGSGLTDKQRHNPPPIGSIITFRYQELTDGGIPRFPTFVGIRIDAAWPPKKNK